jgi:hypothetical protein
MKELTTTIDIDAPASRVWAILARFEDYPRWNPFIRKAEGSLVEGGRLKVLMQPAGTKAMAFHPRLLKVDVGREIRWIGHLLVPGLFSGEHRFRLEELSETRTRLHHSETFRGILVPLFGRTLERDTLRGFNEMNEALKEEAEKEKERAR